MSKTIYVGNPSPWTTPEKMRKCLNSREAIAALDMKEVGGAEVFYSTRCFHAAIRSFVSEVIGKVI
jgi:hypothetical protein